MTLNPPLNGDAAPPVVKPSAENSSGLKYPDSDLFSTPTAKADPLDRSPEIVYANNSISAPD